MFPLYKIQQKDLDCKKSVATKQKFVNRTPLRLHCDRIINTKMTMLDQNTSKYIFLLLILVSCFSYPRAAGGLSLPPLQGFSATLEHQAGICMFAENFSFQGVTDSINTLFMARYTLLLHPPNILCPTEYKTSLSLFLSSLILISCLLQRLQMPFLVKSNNSLISNNLLINNSPQEN